MSEGYGPNVASDADALDLQNVHGEIAGLEEGDLLSVHHPSDQGTEICSRTSPRLVVKDVLNRRITVANDAGALLYSLALGTSFCSIPELVIILISDHVNGRTKYKAHNGVICIDETSVSGFGVKATLNITSEDARDLSALVKFTTAKCAGGALRIEESSSCFHCEGGSYSFSTFRDDCRKCEDNSVCIGTTVLVPKMGYWHSSPFSPFMHLCLVMEACTFENRVEKLKEYYNESSLVQQRLDNFNCSEWRWSEECNSTGNRDLSQNKTGYNQCADGYEGVLCGSCSDGYGHAADGKCKKCSASYVESCIVATLMCTAVLLVVLVKLYLGINGVKAEVLYAIAQEKANIRAILASAPKQQHPASKQSSAAGVASQMNPPSEQGGVEARAHDEGPSHNLMPSCISQPSLVRSEHVEETDIDGDNDASVSSEIKDASSALSDTFNVSNTHLIHLAIGSLSGADHV